MRKMVVIMILFNIISGCKSENLSTVIINSGTPAAISTLKSASTPLPSTQMDQVSSLSPHTSTDTVKGNETTIDEQLNTTSTVTLNTYNNSSVNVQSFKQYLDFIKDNHTDIQDDLIFSAKEDMDLDGNDEVILGFGSIDNDPQSSNIPQIYMLREHKGKIEQLGGNLAKGGYGVYEIKLIRLQNMHKKYIYCGVTNGADLKGFKIFELSNNKINTVVSSASATGAGNDEIKDFNNDGQYDGYVQNRMSYDVLYYSLNRTYVWKNNKFVLSGTYIKIPEYPDNIKDVLTQYISLRALNVEKSPEADKRLSELCVFAKANDIDITWDVWGSAIYREKLDFVIDEKNNVANATVSYKDDNNQKYKLIFHLIKSDGRWCIDQFT